MAKKKLKFHTIRWWSRVFVRRKYKDTLFRKVFQNKKDLLALYNAVNHTDYQDPDSLEITTIDNAIYMSMKNDLSFMIGSVMNLYEHQSSFNPNMPVRGLSYFARLYETYMSRYKLNVYGSRQIRLPMPQYLVFYNGKKNQPDETQLKLSEAFFPPVPPGQEPVLECRVRMLNINMGHNKELMNSCHRLWEYARFVEEVSRNLQTGMALERAVNEAADACIQQNVLKDILIQSRSEVLLMFLTEYDQKQHLENTFEEGRELGFEQGQNQMIRLYEKLQEENSLQDWEKALSDEQYRDSLYKKYNL